MKKFVLCSVLALLGFVAIGQEAALEKFIKEKKQAALAAYEKRDARSHATIVRELNERIAAQPEATRKNFDDLLSDEYYNLACTYALTGDRRNAIAALKKAAPANYRHIQEDNDLDKLRTDPEFKKIVLAAREKSDYVYILQHDGGYGKSGNSDIPEFSYQSSDYEKLKRLRERYNLDSIAGNGHDETAVINLMRWVHYQVPHDGSKGLPDTRNAQSMLKECTRDGLSINCRGLATILNEVYLAAGYQSRMVTCLPKDPNDNDCHVINVVYMPYLRKWVWMDPTFMAYVMDEKGNLLSIGEVRSRIVQNKPLVLNADANRNGGFRQRKSWYLDDYMAKNLYKLECAVSSEYDYETRKKGKKRTYVNLVPAKDLKNKITSANPEGTNIYTEYFTSNPSVFWAPPAGQQKSDFEKVMQQFVSDYNNRNDHAIRNSFARGGEGETKRFWPDGKSASLAEKYGDIRSAIFMGFEADGGTAIFKIKADKKTFAFGMSLSKGKFENFRFHTSSPEINKMLAITK